MFRLLKNFIKINTELILKNIDIFKTCFRYSQDIRCLDDLQQLANLAELQEWFSGKIQRCHRWAPGSIPGSCIFATINFTTLQKFFYHS